MNRPKGHGGIKMKLSTRDIILIGLFAALMAVSAYLKLPNPLNPLVPITFQLFFCLYAGMLLGSFKGGLSQVIYTLIGLAGVPVFSGGGGFQYVVDPKFGFILGFIACAFLTGYLVEKTGKLSFIKVFSTALAGGTLIYIIGITYMWAIMNFFLGSPTPFMVVVGWMISFMIKDFILIIIVAVTSHQIIPVLRKQGYANVEYIR